jgi:hypothetical protein
MLAVAADGHALLALWEQALPLAAPAREALLARDGTAPAPPTVGAQRLRLLERLGDELGRRVSLRSRCPACGDEAAFDVDLRGLAGQLEADDGRLHALAHGRWAIGFRLPAPDDLIDAANADDFVQDLLARCVQQASLEGEAQAIDKLPQDVLAALSAAMDALDPAANLAFDVACPTCSHAWSAPFDPAGALWSKLQGQAERLLVDIDTLAQRHGWTEAEILALSPARRRAYLQLARAG